MPAKKQLTTKANPSASSPKAPPLPPASDFYAAIKQQARLGLRTLLESVMQEELESLLAAHWAERTAERKGYRNGYYQRDLATTQGVIADLNVPVTARVCSTLKSLSVTLVTSQPSNKDCATC